MPAHGAVQAVCTDYDIEAVGKPVFEGDLDPIVVTLLDESELLVNVENLFGQKRNELAEK